MASRLDATNKDVRVLQDGGGNQARERAHLKRPIIPSTLIRPPRHHI